MCSSVLAKENFIKLVNASQKQKSKKVFPQNNLSRIEGEQQHIKQKIDRRKRAHGSDRQGSKGGSGDSTLPKQFFTYVHNNNHAKNSFKLELYKFHHDIFNYDFCNRVVKALLYFTSWCQPSLLEVEQLIASASRCPFRAAILSLFDDGQRWLSIYFDSIEIPELSLAVVYVSHGQHPMKYSSKNLQPVTTIGCWCQFKNISSGAFHSTGRQSIAGPSVDSL
uniref:Uncharacterized protein n=1 Tax=Romanomermis culicivorax TaxID=13658 RepID=A0A915L0S3_ROMCU